jgi:HlyD family secretion protein
MRGLRPGSGRGRVRIPHEPRLEFDPIVPADVDQSPREGRTVREKTVLPPPTPAPARGNTGPTGPGKSKLGRVVAGTIVLGAGLGLAWWAIDRNRTNSSAGDASPSKSLGTRVEVVVPTRGGLGRTVVQPGVVHSFNRAELFAKVSGYLVRQKVDIGDRVMKGEVLAEIDIPELFKSDEQSRAALGQAKAKAKQAEARVLTAQADRDSAAALIQQAEAEIARYAADRAYRRKELDRITALAARNAVAGELVDEKQKEYEAAQAAEGAAVAGVATARAQLAAAEARVVQAQADSDAAKADVSAAEADLAKADVLLDYTRIASPYDGVITHRYFHEGAFIRSASEGGATPVLAVAENDLMRVVILVPDLDVPFVKRGDPATIQIDALQGRTFEGKVARFANAEDEQKLMRTEVDLPNPDNLLRDGMYGTAQLGLVPPSKNLTVPSSALIEQDGQGHGAVYLVRAGKVHRQPVLVGMDDGRSVEIVEGLAPDDQVIVRYQGSIAEGLPVQAEPLSGH